MRCIILLALLSISAIDIEAQRATEGLENELVIEIEGLRNDDGHVAIQLLDENDQVLREGFIKVDQGRAVHSYTDLLVGEYSIMYFHDENDNHEMDTNYFGIPKEGYGFSNDAHGLMGPPSKEKRMFRFSSADSMTLTVRYL